MLLERVYDQDLAQASYVIGCQAIGEAIVIDPRRDVEIYLEIAARNGLSITAVAETHIHADYLSGTRELAHVTDAQIYVSGEGGEDWQYGFDGNRLYNRDTIEIGNIRITALHTPGHTPEHLVFLVTDGAFADEPGYLLSGDLVFAGDVGRPDLLDEAAGGIDTRFEGARQLFESLRATILALPDHVLVFPAHGAGSACGKSLGALPATTVGYERHFAWWAPYLAAGDEAGFVARLLDGQPDAHAYFARMKRQNRSGPALLGERAPLRQVSADQVLRDLEEDRITLVDTRTVQQVQSGMVPGSLAVPGDSKPASFISWVYDPEQDTRPLVVLAKDAAAARTFWDHIVRVGIDEVIGFVPSLDGLPLETPAAVSPAELQESRYSLLLDVRNRSEHAEGTIPGAEQLAAGRVLWHLDQLPTPGDGKIVTFCQSGARNTVISSALRRAGYDVTELRGSYEGWLGFQPSQYATILDS